MSSNIRRYDCSLVIIEFQVRTKHGHHRFIKGLEVYGGGGPNTIDYKEYGIVSGSGIIISNMVLMK